MHLDAFLDKVKQRNDKEKGASTTIEGVGATQIVEPDDEAKHNQTLQSRSNENVLPKDKVDAPPLEASSSDLPEDYVDAWDGLHIK